MIDPNDTLYSKIVRTLAFGRCRRCHRHFGFNGLDCAHIFGRGHKLTRFLLEPKFNAVPLCRECHTWFDSNKIVEFVFLPEKRTLTRDEESFTWLVSTKASVSGKPSNFWNYTWDDLQQLYTLSHQIGKYGVLQKAEVRDRLKAYWKKIS